MKLTVREIEKFFCTDFIYQHHYSKVMPMLTKHYLGIFNEDSLVGTITLGWGTQPLGTINKLFPAMGFNTSHYYEIGKMCIKPQFNDSRENGNWGSRVSSSVVRWMKENTDRIFLYTLADGIVGKVGYVYQASNFYYAGFFWTDVYRTNEGEKIHPRTTRELLMDNYEWLIRNKKPVTQKQEKQGRVFWLTPDFLKEKGINRIRGKMFRYMYPLNKKARRILEDGWGQNYPKDKDLEWKIQKGKGKWDYIDRPKFSLNVVNINQRNVERNCRITA